MDGTVTPAHTRAFLDSLPLWVSRYSRSSSVILWIVGEHCLGGFVRATFARQRIRHGIRHTAALAGRRLRLCVANGRLRHMLIGYARVSKADGSQSAPVLW